MPSFETLADIFYRLSVQDSPKGSSNAFKTRKDISLYFKRRYLIIYKYCICSRQLEVEATAGSHWRGDIAIDDLEVVKGRCPPTRKGIFKIFIASIMSLAYNEMWNTILSMFKMVRQYKFTFACP